VRPALDGKKPTFFGSGGSVHPRIRDKMLEILLSDAAFPWLEESAALTLHTLRQEFNTFRPVDRSTARPLRGLPSSCLAYTFSGTAVNRTISLILRHYQVYHTLIDHESVLEVNQPTDAFLSAWSRIRNTHLDPDLIIEEQLTTFPALLSFSKWGQFLPLPFQVSILKNRHFDFIGTSEFLQTNTWTLLSQAKPLHERHL